MTGESFTSAIFTVTVSHFAWPRYLMHCVPFSFKFTPFSSSAQEQILLFALFFPFFLLTMGRKRSLMKIENPISLQIVYSKRKDGIVKKATELSVLCDTDVGLIMFSPTGRLTSFASKGRVEDIFLRYIDRPDELRGGPIRNEEYLYRSLVHLKYEGEMLEKIEKIEALEENLCRLDQRQHAAQEKMRFYNPDVEKFTSVHEAQMYQKFLTDAIRRIEQLKQAKVLGNQTTGEKPENIEVTAISITDANLRTEESVDSVGKRNLSQDDHHHQETGLPLGPHLSLNYLQSQTHWNLRGSGHASNSNAN
ncbi:hypothetical protein L1049_023343 [Liquidambar formosana]|uniref:MADS-box domain-containing protein n=1 Tax=Liquidambar formosana TaxID=63359 RepID=A0AAP0RSY3_LIQFO